MAAAALWIRLDDEVATEQIFGSLGEHLDDQRASGHRRDNADVGRQAHRHSPGADGNCFFHRRLGSGGHHRQRADIDAQLVGESSGDAGGAGVVDAGAGVQRQG